MKSPQRAYYERNRDFYIARSAAYRASNPEKYKAHDAVIIAIRAGRLVRPDRCEKCLKLCKPHGHHEDYAKPLEVIWLCGSCHRKHHGYTPPKNIRILKGTEKPNAKMTESSVREIRKLLADGRSVASLGRQFGISPAAIWAMTAGRTWKHVQ